jgi:ribosomal-protein-alanine N-acetyltransferase
MRGASSRFRVRWPRWLPHPRGSRPGRPDLAASPVEFAPARRNDIPGIARVFERSFRDTVEHVFGRPPSPRVFRDLFLLCYRSEPAALHVARIRGSVVGYAYSPAHMSGLYRRAMLRGHVWRWAARWLRGEYRFGMQPVRALLLDKFAFFRSSLQGGPRRFPEARILSIAVDPAARGRGIAGGLLRRALGYLRERRAPVVRLEVRPENEPALRLYRSHGFSQVGTTADTRGVWLVMERRLDLD